MTKKILITGKNSYIGNKLTEWLEKRNEGYHVTKISVRNEKWRETDFSLYDVVVHVAGIAHQDTKKDQAEQYYKVNTDLTIEIAKKAKFEGVSQFIFMSSIIVYGSSSIIGERKVITKETIPKPTNFYGNSKLLAEKGILPLQSDLFNIVVIRPPMIYGKNSKGNYPLLSRFAKLAPLFPDVENQRSMLYIDNLCEFIRLMIKNKDKGIYFPQNKDYVKTSELVKQIAAAHNKDIRMTKKINFVINLMSNRIKVIDKVFGNLVYDKKISLYKENYQLKDLNETIFETER